MMRTLTKSTLMKSTLKTSTLAVLALTLALGGCGTLRSATQSVTSTIGGWFGDSIPDAAKPAELVDFKPRATLREAWKTQAGEPGVGLFVPVVKGDGVYLAGRQAVSRVGVDSGRGVWKTESKQPLTAGVGVGENLLWAGDLKGVLHAWDAASGAERWQVQLTSELAGAPLQVGELVVVRTGDGLIQALSVVTGERVWQYSRSLPPLTLRGAGGMQASNGVLYVGVAGGKLIALDAAKGTQFWEATVALPRGATELERIADVMGTPWIDRERVCAVAYQGRIACFNREGGASLWARDASSHTGLAGDGTALYLAEDGDAVVQYDLESGRAGWKQDQLARRKISAPLVFGDYVIVGDGLGFVHVLAREDGSFVARAKVDGAIVAAPVHLGPGFAVQTAKGDVVAFRLD